MEAKNSEKTLAILSPSEVKDGLDYMAEALNELYEIHGIDAHAVVEGMAVDSGFDNYTIFFGANDQHYHVMDPEDNTHICETEEDVLQILPIELSREIQDLSDLHSLIYI